MANRANWFEVPAMDLDRAVEFYGEVLACRVATHKDEGFAVLDYQAGEVSGALVQCENHRPSTDGILIYLNVEGRLDKAIEAVGEYGGTVVEPKTEIGPYGARAIILDTEGNRVALHSYSGE